MCSFDINGLNLHSTKSFPIFSNNNFLLYEHEQEQTMHRDATKPHLKSTHRIADVLHPYNH